MITLNNIPCYPVWQDIILSVEGTSIAAAESAEFEVVRGNKTLLSGTAVKRPGDAYISVRVNDVVSPWVRPRLVLSDAAQAGVDVDSMDTDAPGTMPLFQIVWRALDTAVSQNFYVYGDWSYDRKRGNLPAILASALAYDARIDGRFVQGQFILSTNLTAYTWTLLNTAWLPPFVAATVNRSGAGAGTYFFRVPVEPCDYVPQRYTESFTSDDGAISLSELQELKRDDALQVQEYIRRPYLGYSRYVLYYVNAYGGWDWFVIQGRAVESDAVTRREYTRQGSTVTLPGKIVERGRVLLQNQITKHLELHTHFLTDDEASRMHHLLESQEVYVHDLETDIIHPAIITTTQAPVKTYKNEGHRLFSYQIDLDIATEFGRR